MNLKKALRRDNELEKRKHGHKTDNKNIFLLEELKKKKAEQIRKEREAKEKLVLELEGE